MLCAVMRNDIDTPSRALSDNKHPISCLSAAFDANIVLVKDVWFSCLRTPILSVDTVIFTMLLTEGTVSRWRNTADALPSSTLLSAPAVNAI